MTDIPETKKNNPKNVWPIIGYFLGMFIVSFVAGFFLGRSAQWLVKNVEMSIWAQPLATILTGGAAIAAAWLALHNGNKAREQDRTNQEKMRKHDIKQQNAAQKHAVALHEEAARKDTERGLRDRFFKIVETLSENANYVKREAGVYALVALADDWAVFHQDDLDAARKEQQTCLHVIAGQLRDPLRIAPISSNQKAQTAQYDPALLTFKHRVQEIILERFRPSEGKATGVWSPLDLNLSNCHCHDFEVDDAVFHGVTSFAGGGPVPWHSLVPKSTIL